MPITPGTVETLRRLLAEEPVPGAERLPGGAGEYARLAPEPRATIAYMAGSPPEQWPAHYRTYRTALLQLASLECAAGVPVERCLRWFRCIADLASAPRAGGEPTDAAEAVTCTALARDFTDPARLSGAVPDGPMAERVLHALLTGAPLPPPEVPALFDHQHWAALGRAIRARDRDAARTAFIGIAEWWISEYEDSGVPRFDLSEYPAFEPVPNAALAIANHAERMDIDFDDPGHRLFYVAALMD
ncbi:MAG TPA: hypothetical protein VF006_04750 [Longimicrobium sp.]